MYELILIVFLNNKTVIHERFSLADEKDCVLAEQEAEQKFKEKFSTKYKNIRVETVCLKTIFEPDEE